MGAHDACMRHWLVKGTVKTCQNGRQWVSQTFDWGIGKGQSNAYNEASFVHVEEKPETLEKNHS